MKNIIYALLLAITVSCQSPKGDLSKRTKQEVIDQWQHDRFGIFIHWGASSIVNAGSGSWARKDNNSGPGAVGNKTLAEAPEVIASGHGDPTFRKSGKGKQRSA